MILCKKPEYQKQTFINNTNHVFFVYSFFFFSFLHSVVNAGQQCSIPSEYSRRKVALSLAFLVFLIHYHEHSLKLLSNLPSIVLVTCKPEKEDLMFLRACMSVCVCVSTAFENCLDQRIAE